VRQILHLTIILGLLLSPAFELKAADIELGGGYTFKRYEKLHNAGVASLNLITQEDSSIPTEWSLGYIFSQSKNSQFGNNDDPTAWVGVGKRFHWKNLVLGFGLVAVDQTSQRLSSTLNFKSEGGFHLGPLVLLVQHISNAGLEGSNDGETFFTLSYRFTLGD